MTSPKIPTKFSDLGYLADQMSTYRAEIRQRHGEWLSKIRMLSALGIEAVRKMKIIDNRSLLATFFSAKVIEDVQGATLLLENGQVVQAQQALRSAFEAVVNLEYYAKDAESADRYLNYFWHEEIGLRGKMLKGEYPVLPGEDIASINRRIDELRKWIKGEKIKGPIDFATLVRKTRHKANYNVYYGLYSYSVHTSTNLLNRYLKSVPQSKAHEFTTKPETVKLNAEFFVAAQDLLFAIDFLISQYHVVDENRLTILGKAVLRLGKIRAPGFVPSGKSRRKRKMKG